MSKAYDDGERPSWRDIDKKREGSSHTRQDKKEKKEAPKDRWNEGRYKKALDKLFQGDKGTLEHEKLHNKIHKMYGAPGFVRAAQAYIEKFGPPDDPSTLILLLDSKDTDIMFLTMKKLQLIHKEASPREKEDIRRKLSIISMTDRSADIKEKAVETIEEIETSH